LLIKKKDNRHFRTCGLGKLNYIFSNVVLPDQPRDIQSSSADRNEDS